ncbi:MAG: HpaII family restriction endonuclease [Chitinophagaceae bacterium]|nr:HpaII family restriction endonuclease [Chitinophagaceae bacterium]
MPSKTILSNITLATGIPFSFTESLLNHLKEDSKSKGAINILVHDPSCGIKSQKKFSIKSFIGSTPTLFNANKTTNIIYEVSSNTTDLPMPPNLVTQINAINSNHKYIDRINTIKKEGFNITFKKFEDQTFLLNLELIDSKLPEIIAFAVLEKYTNRISKIQDVIENLTAKNPLGYNLSLGHNFYEYRIINFLVETSLGMTSASVWNGIHDATGGIIIVKDNSEVLCYHLIEFNKFKAYLKKSAKLDNPSGGRMGYGELFEENGKTLIKLNFQVKA